MKSPPFTQVLITRFSVRLDGRSVIRNRDLDWLFSEKRLIRRMSIFANLTFPSVVKSTDRPEFYIIIIDKELPEKYKLELLELVSHYKWVFVHEWVPGHDFTRLGWILDLTQIKSDILLLSLIDDDDALELGANERIRNAARTNLHKVRKGQWVWFGSNNAWEWDLSMRDSEFGYVKPFSGGTSYWQGVGTSVLVSKHARSPTSYTWPHSILQMVFSPFWIWRRAQLQRVFIARLGLLKNLVFEGRFNGIWSLVMSGWLIDVGKDYSSEVDMLISNSGTNLQSCRLHYGLDRRSTEVLDRLKKFGVTEESARTIADVMVATGGLGDEESQGNG